MKRPFQRRENRDRALERMFETRSEAWAAVGLNVELNKKVETAAWRRLAVCLPAVIAVFVLQAIALHHVDHDLREHTKAHPNGQHWLGFVTRTEIRVVAVLLILMLGWLISRDVSRLSPKAFRRMDPSTAGTVEFLVRLLFVAATILSALGVAGTSAGAVAVGGGLTAIVLGLAAQQTLGNLFAGMVLLSARPFRLGERVRLQAGAIGGIQEGTVSSLGLLYTTLARGDDRIMIPNSLVLAAVVVPVREPEAVDVTVSFPSAVRLSQVQEILDAQVSTPTRSAPEVSLESIEGDVVTVHVKAVPDRRSQGAQLADEIIAALAHVTSEHQIATDGAGRD